MKLYLNDNQRNYLLEIFRASQSNAVSGKDMELAEAFNELYEKIKPTNCSYIVLDRAESESIVEFCDIVRKSLDNAISFLDKDTERDPAEVESLRNEALAARKEIEEVADQLQSKIRKNPL
jgi:hypothetical protein